MQNAGLDKLQVRIKIARRNILENTLMLGKIEERRRQGR